VSRSFSGKALIRALERDGWTVVRQRGSHVRLKKKGRRTALVVPLHKKGRRGKLAGILRDAGLMADELRESLGDASRCYVLSVATE
jgi:predicted RNA binding protein YcfA (HicA-like mRNA interferase family)